MGYPIDTKSPQVKVASGTYTVSAFPFNSVIGATFNIYVLQQQPDGSWNSLSGGQYSYLTPGTIMSAVTKAGGFAAYMTTMVATFINPTLNGVGAPGLVLPTITANPSTDAEAMIAIQAAIDGASFPASVPVIPPALTADYANWWTFMPDVYSLAAHGGVFVKIGADLVIYAGLDGSLTGLSRESDLNAVAKKAAGLAAYWKTAYGFNPV